jgi:GT2 family glycosyltransferase
VTVVLPVRDEGPFVEAVLGDLLGQDYPADRLELLVVDGESSDDTRARAAAVAARDGRVRVLANPRRLSSAARETGTREARGEYVLFVDGHCRVRSRTLVRDMVETFRRTGADCLARPQPLVAPEGSFVARAVAAARSSWFGHSTESTIYDERERAVDPTSAGAMYRREVFDRVGSFDPGFDACEDVELNWRVARAGLSCWTSPRLAVEYVPRGTWRGLFRQMVRYGLGRARLHRKHRESFRVESLVPAAFVAGLPALLVAPWLPSPWGAVVAAPYALYGVLALVASVAAASRRGWRLLPALPLAFLAIHAGLGVGYLQGRLERRPRAGGS